MYINILYYRYTNNNLYKMVNINIVGVNGYSFKIDINDRMRQLKKRSYSLFDLKIDIINYLRNRIQEQIYNDLNLDFNLGLGEMDDETFEKVQKSQLFKKWLNVNKTKYIVLMKNGVILDDDDISKNIELQSTDLISYVIKPRL